LLIDISLVVDLLALINVSHRKLVTKIMEISGKINVSTALLEFFSTMVDVLNYVDLIRFIAIMHVSVLQDLQE
jgi:hypothetical protein